MQTDENNNVSGSANMPANPKADEPPASLSEAEFLQQEAVRARVAISGALSDLGRSLKATADPHVLTRDHPWIAISTAAVAGFAAAVTLIPSKEQQALRALAELERARHTPQREATATASDNVAASGGMLGTIAAELLKTVRPLLTTLLSAGIAKAASGAADAKPADTNGHAPDEEIATPS